MNYRQLHSSLYKGSGLMVLLLSTLSFASFGQGGPVQKKDSATYQRALYWLKEGKHDEAKKTCLAILKSEPGHVKIEVLLGRIYSWDKQFDSARIFLKDALSRQPGNEEALEAMINVESWSEHLDQALVYCDNALKINPNSEKVLIKKAKVYNKQGKYREAYKIVQQVLKLNPKNHEAIGFEKYLKRKMAYIPSEKNAIGLSYQYDHFNTIYAPWTYASLYFLHRARGGNLSAAINYANRFQAQGVQYELSLHPRITSSMKGFLGAAYSKDSILPGWNLAAGLSHTLFKRAELEAGVRYLTFSSLPNPMIQYTGALSLSLHRFWVSARTYLMARQAGMNQSYYLTTRYYGKNPRNNITLLLSTGSFPHDYFDPIAGKSFNYSNKLQRIRLSYQTTFFSMKNILKCSLGYEKRSYYSGLALQRVTAGLGIERWF